MTKLEAWYRRNFCRTADWYRVDSVIGQEVAEVQNLKYVYVGKEKIWIKRFKQKSTYD